MQSYAFELDRNIMARKQSSTQPHSRTAAQHSEPNSIGCLLTLSDGRERQYWADAGTQRQLRRVDCLGLAAGVVLNLLDAGYEGTPATRTRRRQMVAFAGLLQLMQLAWLLFKPQSYMRHRVSIAFIQRLRWQAGFMGIMGLGAGASGWAASIVPIQRPLQPGSFLTFLWVVTVVPL
jgi:hypothetical protein